MEPYAVLPLDSTTTTYRPTYLRPGLECRAWLVAGGDHTRLFEHFAHFYRRKTAIFALTETLAVYPLVLPLEF